MCRETYFKNFQIFLEFLSHATKFPTPVLSKLNLHATVVCCSFRQLFTENKKVFAQFIYSSPAGGVKPTVLSKVLTFWSDLETKKLFPSHFHIIFLLALFSLPQSNDSHHSHECYCMFTDILIDWLRMLFPHSQFSQKSYRKAIVFIFLLPFLATA